MDPIILYSSCKIDFKNNIIIRSSKQKNKYIVATQNCLGYSVYTLDCIPENLFSVKTVYNTINPHSYCIATKDLLYSKALHNSDILLPDGIGIVWAIKVLTGKKIKRVSGSDLHVRLLQKLNENGGKIFYLGSIPSTLKKIQDRVKSEFPNITTEVYSPPFKSTFLDEENNHILSVIKKFSPDILFVGMTAPKQEKWVHIHKDKIDAMVIASVGAVFDFYAGTIKRPGKFWLCLGLEWLPRLVGEPKRLWRRNFISTPTFIWYVHCAKIRLIRQKYRKAMKVKS